MALASASEREPKGAEAMMFKGVKVDEAKVVEGNAMRCDDAVFQVVSTCDMRCDSVTDVNEAGRVDANVVVRRDANGCETRP